MKKKKILCAFLVCIIMLSLCRIAPAAAAEPGQSKLEPITEQEITTESETESTVESEITVESEVMQSEPESTVESKVSHSEPESAAKPETATECLPEQSTEPESEPDTSDERMVQVKPTQPPQTPPTAAEPDLVSTGAELTNWLEAHKNTGGTAKLTDNIVLDSYYFFCPNAINMPSLFVDADCYTITVTEEITFMSDAHLTFYGQEQEKGIFYVAKGGLLFLENIAVEGGQNALWQEEGAGLSVMDCRVSGNVHYAKTPFVIRADTDCALVEKGQTAGDALPGQVQCVVNRQGEVLHNELLPVSWNLEGNKTQQKKRLRFEAQGTFLNAVSKEPLSCTVAYHDYPLTFLEVKAIQSPTQCQFRGGYAKPVEALPIWVATEYSFDGKNWITYDEYMVSDASDAFFMGFETSKWDTAQNPYVYIRLHWNDNGKKRFSNVLRYAAGNLSYAEDLGGNRGGGTSITNPPDRPQDNSEPKPSDAAEPSANASSPAQLESLSDTDTQPAESAQTAETTKRAEIKKTAQPKQPSQTAADNDSINDQNSQTTAVISSAGEPFSEELPSDEPMQETVPMAAMISETGGNNPPKAQAQITQSNVSPGRTVAIGAGFAALSAVFGIAGYCLYAAKKRMLK